MNKNLIIRFRYEHLRNELHVEYNETIDGIIAKLNPQALGIQSQYDPYKVALNVEVDTLDVIKKSEYTIDISYQDHVRDKIFRGLSDAVKSSLNHFNADKRKSAEKLNLVFENYGNIAVKTLDEETAAIDDLLRELNGNYAPDVQLLSLNDWLTQLDSENRTFKQLMSKRYTETAQRPTVRMATARVETDKALRTLFNTIDALAIVNGAAAYMPLINELNAVSERYKKQIAQASGKRTKTKND